MSSNSIFSSVTSEERWVIEMYKTFQERQEGIDFDTPPCVFRVPKSLTQTKPEAYAPQQVGLGPYHHLRPELYTMQRKKVAAVMKFLNAEQLPNFQQVVEALMQWEPYVRGSYDQYLDLQPKTLAWIVAIDAIYLLQLLKNYPGKSGEGAAVNTLMKNLAGDILMLENQIPFILLQGILRILNLFPGDGHNDALFLEFRNFCREASPLELNDLPFDFEDIMRQGHLLNVMHHLIVTNSQIKFHDILGGLAESSGPRFYDNVKRGVEIAAAGGVPGAQIVQQQLSLMETVPWDRILGLFRTGDPDEKNSLVEEIDIPSVSQLTDIAGITFALTPGGIRDVKFNEVEKKFYLPVLTLKSNSEVIFRNLLAYEAASAKPGSTLEFAEYVDLMCGIVDTPKDVDILRTAKIIKSDLTDAEIACIFNGIRKSTGNNDKKTTNIEKAIDKVNEEYVNVPRVKAYRFIKKHVYSSWKFLTVLSTVKNLKFIVSRDYLNKFNEFIIINLKSLISNLSIQM
ncbi:hypothetical protein Pfo_000591 [Paulownia fortunei]|nr:hypothetical protein Pfo_000591 [Paulownia fortunei]